MLVDEIATVSGSPRDPTKTSTRYAILALASSVCFGSYFVFDNPSALQTQLQEVIAT